MTTTVTIDEQLAKELEDIAEHSGKPLEQVVDETLHAGLATRRTRYRIKGVSLGGPMPGINLDKALQLSDALEDMEIARKLESGK